MTLERSSNYILWPLANGLMWRSRLIIAIVKQIGPDRSIDRSLDISRSMIEWLVLMGWLKVVIKWSLAELVANRLLPCTC